MLLAEVALAERMQRIDSQLSDLELERAIRACDLVMIPYKTGYNSGMALLCLTCETPVLTSRLPIFEELQEDFGNRWVRTFERPEEIATELEAAVAARQSDQDRSELQARLAERSFAQAAGLLAEFAGQLLPPLPQTCMERSGGAGWSSTQGNHRREAKNAAGHRPSQ
jgi:glycosyltransferase involved in cell wall biosynthesis